jgi:hypothetical protein
MAALAELESELAIETGRGACDHRPAIPYPFVVGCFIEVTEILRHELAATAVLSCLGGRVGRAGGGHLAVDDAQRPQRAMVARKSRLMPPSKGGRS